MTPSRDNRVIIRIWASGYNEVTPGVDVGHISIEIKDSAYVSLWPITPAPSLTARQPFTLLKNYTADYEAEGRTPEVIICLYSLDTEAMLSKFESIKKQLQHWTVMTGSPVFRNGDKVHSCASIALKILKVGGLEQLACVVNQQDNCCDTTVDFANTSCVSPDSVLRLVSQAKLAELEQYEETKGDWYRYLPAAETCIMKLRRIAAGSEGLASIHGKVALTKSECILI